MRLRKDHVLAAGRQRRELRVRPGFTPERNYRRERIRHALLDLWVPLVPRPLRSRRPFARYFWQQAEVDHINARARALAVELGWDTSEPESAAPVAAGRPPIDQDVEAGRDVSGEGPPHEHVLGVAPEAQCPACNPRRESGEGDG